MLVLDAVYGYKGTNTGYDGYRVGSGFSEYMKSRVGPWHRDEAGDQILLAALNVEQVGFDPDTVSAHVSNKSWRVGESLAECFLADYRDVSIPNKIRDVLNFAAPQHGVDIAGITKDNLFAMGEVKTTSDLKHPPGVVYGNYGMIAQMTRIASDSRVRDGVMRWLGFRDQSGVWGIAARKYHESNKKAFKIFGIMVRDTLPDERDVKKIHNDIATILAKSAFLDVVALYLPIKKHELPKIMEDIS